MSDPCHRAAQPGLMQPCRRRHHVRRRAERVACDEGCEGTGTARTVVAIGVAGYVVSTIADIATAPSAARRHNRERRAWTLAPVASRDGGGLAIAGQL
jgi:hypothetical protein